VTAEAHRVQVGAELRRARELLGLSGVQVAAELGWSQSKVSRIEAGLHSTSLNDLSALLNYYGLSEEVRAELLSVAVSGDGLPGAWIVRAGGPPRRQGEVAAIETRVRRIRQYAALIIPGLLQAERFIREVARAAGFLEIEDIARQRLGRQKLFFDGAWPVYEVVLDERALLRTPGDQSVVDQQLRHLMGMLARSQVDLRLLPTGSRARRLGVTPFLLYEFRDDSAPAVVQLESMTADTYLSAADDVLAYTHLFDDLAVEALSPADSRDYLRSMLTASTPI
jgi:transcriptional regulator with XRE-family HTH domain